MKTYEMVALAETNSKIYIVDDMRYNKTYGFHNADKQPWPYASFEYYATGLDVFMHYEGWQEFSEPEYTLEELYELVGHPFKLKSMSPGTK